MASTGTTKPLQPRPVQLPTWIALRAWIGVQCSQASLMHASNLNILLVSAARSTIGVRDRRRTKARIAGSALRDTCLSAHVRTDFRHGAGARKNLRSCLGRCSARSAVTHANRAGGCSPTTGLLNELHGPSSHVAAGNIDQVETNCLDDSNCATGRAELPHRFLDVEIDRVVTDIQDHPDIPG